MAPPNQVHVKGGMQMIYPYTNTAKVIQFPWKFYFTKSPIYQHWLLGVAITIPLFYKIGKAVNSPDNKKKWKELHEKEWAGPHH